MITLCWETRLKLKPAYLLVEIRVKNKTGAPLVLFILHVWVKCSTVLCGRPEGAWGGDEVVGEDKCKSNMTSAIMKEKTDRIHSIKT